VRSTTIRRRRAGAALALGAVAAVVGLTEVLRADGDSSRPAFSAGDLPLRELAGSRLIAGFDGPRPPRSLRAMIRRGELAGVVLFSENFSGPAAARRLVRRLQSIRRPRHLRTPLLVMIDQEGGAIRRLPGPPQPSAEQMGERGPSFSRSEGEATAHTLIAAGVNVDLAPVLDVARPGSVIGEEMRSFGSSAATVSASATAFADGLRAGGVAATGKHFPGFGGADVNTDFGVAKIGLSKAALRRVDERPFEAFAAAGGELVMLSTAIYPAFSPRPAAVSRAIATGELRHRIGFDGVSVTDDLQSAAARAFGSAAVVGRAAAAAGTDLLLFRHFGAAAQAGARLRRALSGGSLSRPEFDASAQRVLDLRAGLAG
jgi:beta-N-acetylhexosaminidase